MKNSFFAGLLSLTIMISCQPDKQLTNYVNPLLGTATAMGNERSGLMSVI